MAKQTLNKASIIRWQKHCKQIQKLTAFNGFETDKQKADRIELAKKDYDYFVDYYFPHYAKSKCADFHIKAANKIKSEKEIFAVFEWARGHAKSTHMGVMIPMWLKMQGELKVMVLVGQNDIKASKLLGDLQAELESNQRYISDFGEQYNTGNWQEGEFTTIDCCNFISLGKGANPRGLKKREIRPDYIVVDDLDDDELVLNEKRVAKLVDWVLEALYMTMDMGQGRFIMVGNRIHKNSVLANIAKTEGTYHTIVNALDKKGVPSWFQKYTIEQIQKVINKIGWRRAQKELFNNPISEGTVFKEMSYGKCPPLSSLKFVVVYSDPSPSNKDKGKNKNASHKSAWLIGFKDGKFYIYKGYLEQTNNATFVQWLYDLRNYVNDKTQVYNFIENNSLQDPFYEQVFKPLFHEFGKTQGILSITPDSRKKPDKFARIEGNLEPLNRQGLLILNEAEKDNPHMKRLEEQFLLVDHQLNSPADGPDSIEGGVFKINEKIRNGDESYVLGQKQTNKYKF